LEQEEPLKAECQHFLDCIETGVRPLTSGHQGLELVQILEAASKSLKDRGGPVSLTRPIEFPMDLTRSDRTQVVPAEALCV
jgi:hypothetical protein